MAVLKRRRPLRLAARPPLTARPQGGFTLIELVIGAVVAFIVVFALGRIILQSQRSWEQGRDKTVLQQNVTEALEWMARATRAAHTLVVVGDDQLLTFDETGALVHTFARDTTGVEPRLLEDGGDLVDRRCTLFAVTPDPDTTSVTLTLELEDNTGTRVAATTRGTVRNRPFEF